MSGNERVGCRGQARVSLGEDPRDADADGDTDAGGEDTLCSFPASCGWLCGVVYALGLGLDEGRSNGSDSFGGWCSLLGTPCPPCDDPIFFGCLSLLSSLRGRRLLPCFMRMWVHLWYVMGVEGLSWLLFWCLFGAFACHLLSLCCLGVEGRIGIWVVFLGPGSFLSWVCEEGCGGGVLFSMRAQWPLLRWFGWMIWSRLLMGSYLLRSLSKLGHAYLRD
ncbi:hypothetical protein SUGI_0103290 [Cryptomeria japonica]|nr:hypothetical protein SUGI_0103290 [Cryptomeria japonica]